LLAALEFGCEQYSGEERQSVPIAIVLIRKKYYFVA
jgi:hypothetical protein